MKLMFVYWQVGDAGSAQTIAHYCRSAKVLGHQAALFAPAGSVSGIPCSLDIESADAAIFPLEWNIYLHNNEPLDLDTPVRRIPRERRVVIDCDGMYADVTRVAEDYNHPDEAGSRARTELYDSIADKIFQPTFHPRRPNVGTFFFHAYHPGWERPLDFRNKEYGMFYVGSNWFRWRALRRVLDVIEPIRNRVCRIGLAGHNWTEQPWGADDMLKKAAYYTDPEYLKRIGVELRPPVPYSDVISTMSRAVFNPVLIRPLFSELGLVTVRTFETPASNTIPLLTQDPNYVSEVYGDEAVELILPTSEPAAKILDIMERPERYAPIVESVRQHLRTFHSFEARVKQLVEIVRS
jgi:Glycosyl transferases group 1